MTEDKTRQDKTRQDKTRQDNCVWTKNYVKSIPINPDPDGVCRTLKSQYQKNGLMNFVCIGSYGATGVLDVFEVVEK